MIDREKAQQWIAQSNLVAAENLYRCILGHEPCNAEVWNDFGNILKRQNRTSEALDAYDNAVRLKHDFAIARHNRSFLLLQQGDLTAGWQEHEWRWACPDMPKKPANYWDGGPTKTIVLHTDQGSGDTFQFIRYAHRVKQRCGEVLLYCKPSLIPILSRCPGIDAIFPAGFDTPVGGKNCYLTSLPAIFDTSLNDIPTHVPYITADPKLAEHWRTELPAGFKVGIAWQGNPQFKHDKTRSIPVSHYGKLVMPGVQLICLQKYDGMNQLAKTQLPMLDYPHKDIVTRAFSDTAAIMANLDLIVTSDTSIAHLAGAMGARVWVALSHNPEWRWLLKRSDSPWYPTMRLFRQPQPNDWDSVFTKIAAELAKLVG